MDKNKFLNGITHLLGLQHHHPMVGPDACFFIFSCNATKKRTKPKIQQKAITSIFKKNKTSDDVCNKKMVAVPPKKHDPCRQLSTNTL